LPTQISKKFVAGEAGEKHVCCHYIIPRPFNILKFPHLVNSFSFLNML